MITRSDKLSIVNDLRHEIESAVFCSVVCYDGLTVNILEQFRKDFHAVGAKVKAIKKTLLSISAQNHPLNQVLHDLPGQVALVYSSSDPFQVLKVMFKSSLKVISGVIEHNALNADALKSLNNIGSVSGLYCNILRAINAPMYKMVMLFKLLMYKFLYCIKVIKGVSNV